MAFLAFLKKKLTRIIVHTHNINPHLWYFLVLCADMNTWFKEQKKLAAVLCYSNMLRYSNSYLSHKVKER